MMKIAIFSINPIFPEVVTGGASKHLFHIARHLGTGGHSVAIYCAQTDEHREPFTWAENVLVFPILPFDLPFPQPYAVCGPDLALITERLITGVSDADRFYIHDGEWLIPDTYQNISTITSFRDNIYPESVLGTFITKADDVICVSPYSASIIKDTAGRFFPDLQNRIHQVNNGIDFNQFTARDPSPLANELGLDPDRDVIILHPHRPEPGKGLSETIQVAGRLVNQHGLINLKVLVPEWINKMVSEGEKDYHEQMLQLMQDLGVQEHFVFIPWMPNDRMPELYSLSDVTLCLGKIVEAFGNVAYESLACGTPSVVVRVGVHRTMMPETLIKKVHPGDIETAVVFVMDIVKNGSSVSKAAKEFLHEHMDFDQQIEAYVEIIENCAKRERIQFCDPQLKANTPYRLAPWCYFVKSRIYHDFRGRFEPAPKLAELCKNNEIFTRDLALGSGIQQTTWDSWLSRTLIVPKLT